MKKIPTRDKVKPADTWDLTSLFPSDDAWEKAFKKWAGRVINRSPSAVPDILGDLWRSGDGKGKSAEEPTRQMQEELMAFAREQGPRISLRRKENSPPG